MPWCANSVEDVEDQVVVDVRRGGGRSTGGPLAAINPELPQASGQEGLLAEAVITTLVSPPGCPRTSVHYQ